MVVATMLRIRGFAHGVIMVGITGDGMAGIMEATMMAGTTVVAGMAADTDMATDRLAACINRRGNKMSVKFFPAF